MDKFLNTHQRTSTMIQVLGLRMVKRVFASIHRECGFLDIEQLQKIYQVLQIQKLLHIGLVSELF